MHTYILYIYIYTFIILHKYMFKGSYESSSTSFTPFSLRNSKLLPIKSTKLRYSEPLNIIL